MYSGEKEENVMFLGSKLYTSGKRVPAKTYLKCLPGLDEGASVMFDAVPIHPSGLYSCRWFATIVWKGRKPSTEYDKTTVPVTSNLKDRLRLVSKIY